MFSVPEKLLIRRTSDHLLVAYDEQKRFCLDTVHILFCTSNKFHHKYLLALLNSSFLNFLYNMIVPETGKAFAEVKIVNLKKLPIKNLDLLEQNAFIEKADQIIHYKNRLEERKWSFINLLVGKWKDLLISAKLTEWHGLSFEEFRKELDKQKVKLTLPEQSEWLPYFNTQQQAIQELQRLIEGAEVEIDDLTYRHYQLTDHEIEIVKNSLAHD